MQTLFFAVKNNSGRENVSRRILLVALLALFLCPLSAFAQCNTSWTGGGSGLWNAAGNWSAGEPTNATNTCINTAGSTVTLNIAGAATSSLTLGLSTDSLSFNNGTSLTVSGSSISNAGSITMNSTGSTTELVIGASSVTLSGGGTLTLSNSAGNIIFGSSGANVLVNQSTIQGSGNIGDGQMGLNNSGTIDANQTTSLRLQISTGATNTGTLEATNGATLDIFGGTYTNTGGTILNNASTLLLEGAVVINGGTITQMGAGTIKLSNATVNTSLTNTSTGLIDVLSFTNNTVAGAIINPNGGQLKIENGAILTLGAGSSVSNAGTFSMNSTGNTTELVIGASSVTLSGSSTLTLSNSAGNIIFGSSGANVLVNQSTIQGSGNIGDGQMGLNNSGTIDANQTTSLRLQISTGATNTGTLEATNGATLDIFGGTYTNTGGTILNNASTLLLEGAVVINGGTITQMGAGTIKLSNATVNTSLTNTSTGLIDVLSFTNNTVAGAITNPNGGQLKIENGAILTLGAGSSVSNAGTFSMNSTGNTTELVIGASSVTLSGSSTLTLSNSAGNIIFGSSGANVLMNQTTIQGAGNIGDGQMGLNNSGTIDANQTTNLRLQISTGATNTGTLEATNGATLDIFGGTYTNTGGTILNNASTLLLEGAVVINGGTITQMGAGTIKLSNATVNTSLTNTSTGLIDVLSFTNNTVAGAITNPNGGQLKIENGAILTLGAGSSVSNAGTFSMNSTGNTTELVIGASSVTLSGSSTLTLSNSAGNIIFGSSGANVLVNQSTIQGSGNIGDGQMGLNNSGTINANGSAGMTLQISSGATNTGTLEATSGAILTIFGGTYTQTGAGKILATGANSEVLLDDATIIGGTLTGASTGKFVAENDSTLNGVTISSGTIMNMGNGQVLNLAAGTITNKGTINVGSTGSTTELVINGAVTLASTGKIILSASPDNFILGSGTLTNQNTIEGEGNIGDGEIGLVNSGSILANEKTASTLFIDTNGTGFTNNVGTKNGILNVSAKNTVIIEGGPLNNLSSGTLTGGEYLVSGELEFAGGTTGIVTNNAIITLTGATAKIFNTTNSTNALANFATNGTKGVFTINGATFTTSGNFTNSGTIAVGTGAKFAVGTNGADDLTNYSGATSTLTGGTYTLTGTGQLQFNNQGNTSDIVTNDASITLAGVDTTKSSIIDQTGANALANFNANGSTGSLTLTTDRNFATTAGFTNAGTVTVSKSTGTGHTLLTINGSYQNTGTTTVDGMLTATSINVTGGFIYGNLGTITGAFDLTGGTLNPGDGIKKEGTLNIAGNYTETGSGILNIDLDGTVAGTKYDVLNISGTAALGGTLDFDLISTFKPTVGETFDVINYSSETGSFTTVNLPTAPAGDHWTFACGATDCTLTLNSGAAGPAAQKSVPSAAPAKRVSPIYNAAVTAGSMREPSAILTRAETCGGFRTFSSLSCVREAISSLANVGVMHAVASHGTAVRTLHNNVATVAMSGVGVRTAASHTSTAPATSMARLYMCAYMPESMTSTMGCR